MIFYNLILFQSLLGISDLKCISFLPCYILEFFCAIKFKLCHNMFVKLFSNTEILIKTYEPET